MPSKLNDTERVNLWKQRFHEAQGGAEDFISKIYGEDGLRAWIAAIADIESRLVQETGVLEEEISEFWRERFVNAIDASAEYIYRNFGGDSVRAWIDKCAEEPESPSNADADGDTANINFERENPEIWKKRYFRSQAAAEEFILGSFGKKALDDWIDANSSIAAQNIGSKLEHNLDPMQNFMERLFNQLQLYDSKIEFKQVGPAFSLVNRECGILRYRKQAEARGVKLTFESPCHYCMALNKAIAEKHTGKEVQCERTDVGCVWSYDHE